MNANLTSIAVVLSVVTATLLVETLLFASCDSRPLASNDNHHRHIRRYFDILRADISKRRPPEPYIEWMRPLQRWIQLAPLTGAEMDLQRHIAHEILDKDLQFDFIDFYHMDYNDMRARAPDLFDPPRSDFSNSPNVVGVKYGACRACGASDRSDVQVDQQARQRVHMAPVNTTCKGRSLILNGHVDVVPVGDASAWKLGDPHSGRYDPETKRVHGRGSTDMLGGIFSSYLALKAVFQGLNATLMGDLYFETVVEEESGGAGSLSTALRGYRADAAIIPEPTDLRIFVAQQGSMWFRITIHGVAAHGGTRIHGVSAIEKGIKVVEALRELERKRNVKILQTEPLYARFRDLPPEKQLPVPINLGKIYGGEWPSSVCDKLTIEGRMGVFGETMQQARQQLQDALESVFQEDDFLSKDNVRLEWFGPKWVPNRLDPGHPLVRSLSEQLRRVKSNEEPRIESAPWGTDAGYLMTAGNTPTIVFGPGTTSLAHQTDETISMESVLDAAEVIAHTIVDWCGVAS